MGVEALEVDVGDETEMTNGFAYTDASSGGFKVVWDIASFAEAVVVLIRVDDETALVVFNEALEVKKVKSV